MKPKTILANLMLMAAVAGCESVGSPVEPVEAAGIPIAGAGPSRLDLPIVSSVLAGLEELVMTYSAVAPVGDAVSAGDSLVVSITDLLGLGGLGFNIAPSYNTSANTYTVEDGESVTVSGTTKVQTSKVKYSDGSSAWEQEVTHTKFKMKSKTTSGECMQQEAFSFRDKAGNGADQMQQHTRVKVVCPGEGRVFFLHQNIHTVFTPSGKANSQIKETCVSRSETYPCFTNP